MRFPVTSFMILPILIMATAPVCAAPIEPVPVAELVKAVDIPHDHFTLPNGLRVYVHTDRKAPIVAVSVWYHIGSKNEPKGKTGFAHLFEHLMFNGSENAPGDFFEPLRSVGATDSNGTTSFDRTNYFETVPTGALDLALFLESDRMGHLLGGITKEKLDNQRGVVQNEKRQGDNAPYGLAFYTMLETLFPNGHPYSHSTIGSMADLDAASLDDVKQWFRDNYGPNNAVLVLAGDIDTKTAREKVEKWFGDIPAGPAVVRPKVEVPTLASPVAKVLKDRVAATRLYRLWAIPGLNDAETEELQIAGSVLGGLSSSRLDNALVRKEKVAVSVSAAAQAFEDVGIFFVSMDVKPGVDATAAGVRLDATIAEFLKTGPSKDEVRRAVTGTVVDTISGLESVGGFGGKAVTLAEGAVYANDSAAYKQDMIDLATATPDAVAAAARKWLSRPVFSLIIEPGERDAYQEAAGSSAKQQALPATFNYRARADADIGAPHAAVDRSKFPDVGSLKGLDFPDLERAKLANGIEVILARRSAIPMIQANINFDAGYAADPLDGLGTQSLMLALMSEGTKSRTSTQIAEESERLGADIDSDASMDRTSFTLRAPGPNMGAAFALLADIIRNPAFAAGEVERVREQQLARISAELNEPSELADRTLAPHIFGARHPYGRGRSGSGEISVVKSLSAQQLRTFHQQWIRPQTTRIFVVGNTDMANLKPLLEKSFGNWKPNKTAAPKKNFSIAIPNPVSKILLVDRPNSPQSVILAGQVLADSGRDDLVALKVANEVLGGNFLSRINTDLRETKGWSYGTRTRITTSEDRVAFTMSAPVQADKTGASIIALIDHSKSFLGPKGITGDELVQTVNGNVRGLPGSFETSGDVMGGLLSLVNLGRPDNYYEALAEKYHGLTIAEIDATARKTLDPGKLVFVVVGDAKKVRPQLDAVGLPVEDVQAPSAQ